MATSSTSYNFDGTDDKLTTSNTTTYNFTTQDFTVVAWQYADVATGDRSICGNAGGVNTGWAFKTSDSVTGNITLTKLGIVDINSGLTVTASQWEAIAAVVDVDSGVTFYRLNNAGTLSTGSAANGSNINSSAADLEIGSNGNINFFDGAIKYVQIFNRLLTASEITCAMFTPGSITNGLIGFWPVYGELNPDPDLSTTGSDGTTSGSPTTRNDVGMKAVHAAGFIT